jgi:hypothetical protein
MRLEFATLQKFTTWQSEIPLAGAEIGARRIDPRLCRTIF